MYVPPAPDTTLTPHKLLHILSTVRDFWYGNNGLMNMYWLRLPYLVRDIIKHSPFHASEDEKRMAALQYSLQTQPGISWGKIAGVLWYMEEHTALEKVRKYLPHKPGDYWFFPLYMCMYIYLVPHAKGACANT